MQTGHLKTGSAVVRRTGLKSPMELLVSLIDDDPTADNERLFRKWLDTVREDEDYFIPALRHTFTNLMSSLDRDRRARAPYKPQQATTKVLAGSIKNQVAQIILLNMTLPSGKLLRDATFKECYEAGGWFIKVSRQGKPNQIVGKTMTEDKLRKLL